MCAECALIVLNVRRVGACAQQKVARRRNARCVQHLQFDASGNAQLLKCWVCCFGL